ncbi:MAG: fatty acid desaturase family protein, partial [Thermoleophilaceae bacterium]
LVMTLVDLALTAAGLDLDPAPPAKESRVERARRKLDLARRKAVRRKPARSRGIEAVVRQLVDRKSFREPFKRTLWANVTANIVRNLWSNAIIFCGHFPDQTYTFSQEETEDETTGQRYVRQLVGAANIEGGPFFHVMSGNLGYQVEHHLYPDMPSSRYGEIAPQVREICKKYDLPYNSGPLFKQWSMVQRTILRLAFPGGKPRPKPGPYRGEAIKTAGERDLQAVAANGSGD